MAREDFELTRLDESRFRSELLSALYAAWRDAGGIAEATENEKATFDPDWRRKVWDAVCAVAVRAVKQAIIGSLNQKGNLITEDYLAARLREQHEVGMRVGLETALELIRRGAADAFLAREDVRAEQLRDLADKVGGLAAAAQATANAVRREADK